MIKAVGNVLKGIGISIAAPIMAPFLALVELAKSVSPFIG